MKYIGKIVGLNLLVLLGYMALLFAAHHDEGHEWQLAFIIYAMLVIFAHMILNFVIALSYFVRKNDEMGKAWILSSLIILIVGFSTCMGGLPVNA